MPFHFERGSNEDTKERKTIGSSPTIKTKSTTLTKGQSQTSTLKLKKYNLKEHEFSQNDAKTPVSSVLENPQFSNPHLLKKSEIELYEADLDSQQKEDPPSIREKDHIVKEPHLKRKKVNPPQQPDKPTPQKRPKVKKKGL
jgi:hypothetical protein